MRPSPSLPPQRLPSLPPRRSPTPQPLSVRRPVRRVTRAKPACAARCVTRRAAPARCAGPTECASLPPPSIQLERAMISRTTDARRDYSTISPSALSLLLMKSGSSIAFAKQAATLLWNDSVPDELAHAMTAENARRRLRHFENRYRSLDHLLLQAGCPNVLEIGAGLSFRGLELCRTSPIYYLDTDLP